MAAKEKSQSEKFIEKAKELGADESGEKFERAFKKIVPAKPRPKKAIIASPSRRGPDD